VKNLQQFFEFNGIRSSEFGLQIVRLDSGMFGVPMVSSKGIVEDEVTRSLSPYFYRAKYQPLTFKLTFTTLDGVMDTDTLYKICGWLFTSTYKPFISSEKPSVMLYCMGINQSDFITNGLNSGYFEIEFRARDPYYLTLPSVQTFDLSDNETETMIQIINYSNIGQDYYYPEVEFELLDNSTGIQIYNINDGNRLFGFSGLNLLEKIYVDNHKKIIISESNSYRFDKLTGRRWLRLTRGVNNLRVVGKCNLQFRCQFPIFN